MSAGGWLGARLATHPGVPARGAVLPALRHRAKSLQCMPTLLWLAGPLLPALHLLPALACVYSTDTRERSTLSSGTRV